MKTLPLFLALLLTTSCFGGIVPGPVPPTVHTITTTNYVQGTSGVLVWDGTTLYCTNDLGGVVITNIYVQIIVVSNIVAGNIQGPTNTLAMFTPDDFGLGASIAYQTGVDSVTFNGTGNPFIGMGPTNGYYASLEAISTNLTLSLGGGMVVTNGVFAADSTLGINLGGVIRTTWPSAGATVNPTSGRIPINDAGAFVDSPFYLVGTADIGFENKFYLGGGTTNVLRIDGGELEYSNNAANVFLAIRNNSNKLAEFGLQGGNTVIFGGSGSPIYLSPNLGINGSVIVNTASFTPDSETKSLGLNSSNGAWVDEWFKGTLNVQGHNDGSGNSTGLAVSHSGIGGDVTYNSRSSGTDGNPGKHKFDLGGTNVVTIADGSITFARGMTKAVKATLTPAEGMMVFQTDNTPGLRVYQSGAWMMVSTVADP